MLHFTVFLYCCCLSIFVSFQHIDKIIHSFVLCCNIFFLYKTDPLEIVIAVSMLLSLI